ncbi:hypothetical protein QBC39DRAFT_362166 [Podospora conica]|nr:hypothetical protein QBC39DRAFT_362166 [Schizothecium conicum]
MDVVGALSIIGSLLAFTSSALVIAQVITRGDANTKSLTEELEVIELILTECVQSLDTHAKTGTIPPSIGRCLVLCERKRNDAIEIMDKIYGVKGDSLKKRNRVLRTVRFAFFSVAYEQPLIARFNSFRDTAMLLRELSSDFRIENHIIQLSSAMTLLLNEDRDPASDAGSTTSVHDYGEDHPPGEHHPDRPEMPPRPRRRRDANQFLFDFLMLQKFNFTRDIIVLIERADAQGADMYEHIPLRNIVDSGSEENFINRGILTHHSMDPAKIRELSEDEQKSRTLRTISGSNLTPTHEVTLYWHRLKDTTQRRARFLVVDNPDFDVIIGSSLWSATEGPNRGYLAIPGYQTWKEKRKMKKIAAENIRNAWDVIRRQKEEALTTSGTSGASSTAGGG